MLNAKQAAREVLDALPDDCSFADIAHHLCTRELIEEGRSDLRERQTYSHEEIERELAQWLGR